MNSSRFFVNEACEYYPCHKSDDALNCMFCYCPFYSWEICPGVNQYIERPDGRKIKVCSDCTFAHRAENYDRVMDILKMGKSAYEKMRCPIETKFYGIGVGPGDGELITAQAENIIRKVDVLILPAKDKESCRAYTIAASVVSEIAGKECIFEPFPMSMKEPELSAFHERVADKVSQILSSGKSVGFLTIGDVSIYSTYVYIERLVKEKGFQTEYVCGIPSFVAAASRLGIALTLGSEELHVIPGSGNIEEALKLSGTKVFMKSGKRLTQLKEKLTELETIEKIEVYSVSNCGMENEVIAIGTDQIRDDSGYLTVVIVR